MNPAAQDHHQPQNDEDYDLGVEEHDEMAPSSPQASTSAGGAAGDKKQVIRGARYAGLSRGGDGRGRARLKFRAPQSTILTIPLLFN